MQFHGSFEIIVQQAKTQIWNRSTNQDSLQSKQTVLKDFDDARIIDIAVEWFEWA